MKSSNCKLVHVEDNQDDAEVFQRVFKKSGLDIGIEHYSDGKSAFDFLDSLACSNEKLRLLVVLDLNLPLMTGSEILKKLHDSSKTKIIPIVVLSGSENPKDRELCLSLGAREFFVKPWDLDGYKVFMEEYFLDEIQKVCPECPS